MLMPRWPSGKTRMASSDSSSRRQFVGDYRRDGPMERSEPVRVTLAAPSEPVRIVITKLR